MMRAGGLYYGSATTFRIRSYTDPGLRLLECLHARVDQRHVRWWEAANRFLKTLCRNHPECRGLLVGVFNRLFLEHPGTVGVRDRRRVG